MSSPAPIYPPETLEEVVELLAAFIHVATVDRVPAIAGHLGRLTALANLRIVGATLPSDPPDEWLETAPAAKLMGFSPSWLYGHKDEFSFCAKRGGRYRFSRKGIEAWLKRGRG